MADPAGQATLIHTGMLESFSGLRPLKRIKLPRQKGYLAMTPFQRITTNPEICGGKPCIHGLRVPVSRLLSLLAAGETSETTLTLT